MKYILSWGGGINSTAILAMIQLKELPELTKENSHIVMADTCAEMPYTYEHTNMVLAPMARDGWKVTIIHPNRNSMLYSKRSRNIGLMEYCLKYAVMPSRINRWCTMEYKSKPIKKYRELLEVKTKLILGISSDEAHRAKARYAEDTYYPLIEYEVTRQGCIDKIAKAKLPIARKSGCYFCPYQRKAQWLELYKNFPDLFNEAVKLEQNARKKYKGKAYWLIKDLPLQKQIKKWIKKDKSKCQQKEFEEFGLEQHCFCNT